MLAGHNNEPQKLYSAARPLVAAGAAIDREGPVLVLTGSAEQAERWMERLQLFMPHTEEPSSVSLYAEPEALPFERIPWTDARGSAA